MAVKAKKPTKKKPRKPYSAPQNTAPASETPTSAAPVAEQYIFEYKNLGASWTSPHTGKVVETGGYFRATPEEHAIVSQLPKQFEHVRTRPGVGSRAAQERPVTGFARRDEPVAASK